MCYCFSGFAFQNCGYGLNCALSKETCGIMICGMNSREIE